MKILKGLLGLFMAVSVANAQAASSYTVWVNNAWIDGVMKVSGIGENCYITDSTGNLLTRDYSVQYNAKKIFYARPPTGHEVTMWSWEAHPYGTTAINTGHFSTTNVTHAYTLTWTGATKNMDLGVQLDWLKYTLAFDGNGSETGSGTTLSDVIYTNKVTLAANPFARTGYSFKEWQLKNDEAITFSDQAKLTGEDLGASYTNKSFTLVAQWTNNVYAVTFDAAGGSFAGEESVTCSETYDENYVLPENPTRTGYSFLNWTNELGDVITSQTKMTTAGSETLYASWSWVPPEMKVTFKAGVVSSATLSFTNKQVTCQAKYGALPTATARGYEFQGWYTTQMGGTLVTSGTIVTEEVDHSLYAHWYAYAYQIELDPVGGTVSPNHKKITYDEYFPALPTPTRTGYTFAGWWTESAGGKEVKEGDVVDLIESETPKLYARWTVNGYTIAFDANGGTGTSMATMEMQYDVITNLPACTYSNGSRTFVNWLGSDKRTFADQATVSNLTGVANATYTMTAQWSEDYIIAFDGNGATSGEMAEMKLERSQTVALTSNEFARTGYQYLGWATNAADAASWKVKYADGESVKGLGQPGETVRLFAVWTNNLSRVRFYPNGGEGTPFERTFAYDVPQNLPDATAFTREKYALVGWLSDPTNTVYFTPSQSVSNLTAEADAVVPLFAKWQPLGEDLGAYSVAADCDKTTADRDALALTVKATKGDNKEIVDASLYCTVVSNVVESIPGPNHQYISLRPTVGTENNPVTATAAVDASLPEGAGVFSFDYRLRINFVPVLPGDNVNCFTCSIASDPGGALQTNLVKVTETAENWVHVEYRKPAGSSASVQWIFTTYWNADDKDYVHIDNVAWLPDERDAGTVSVTFRRNDGTPSPTDILTNVTYSVNKAVGTLPVLAEEDFGGWSTNLTSAGLIDETWLVPAADTQLYAVWSSSPVPGPADAPAIGSFGRTSGGFSLSFVSDARFDYQLMSTLTLSPPNWIDEGESVPGTGSATAMEILVGDDPAKFYKVKVLQRGAK